MANSKIRKTPVVLVARARAAWNKDGGGVLLTGRYLRNDKDGEHYRVVVDGGNTCRGKPLWVLSQAHGGNYCLRDEAMAMAVAAVIGVSSRELECEWCYGWKERARALGWTLLDWGAPADTIALIPSDAVAKRAKEEYWAWEEKYGK